MLSRAGHRLPRFNAETSVNLFFFCFFFDLFFSSTTGARIDEFVFTTCYYTASSSSMEGPSE
jgi:hypothetical protein